MFIKSRFKYELNFIPIGFNQINQVKCVNKLSIPSLNSINLCNLFFKESFKSYH